VGHWVSTAEAALTVHGEIAQRAVAFEELHVRRDGSELTIGSASLRDAAFRG
jgi:hypothetical protein